jgi:hypothetical protein
MYLFFIVNDKRVDCKYFYDKRSKKLTGFKKIIYDNDFFEKLWGNIFSYGDYFIGKSSPADLSELKKMREKTGNSMSKAVSDMIDSLNEEDNDVLVLFKIKEF